MLIIWTFFKSVKSHELVIYQLQLQSPNGSCNYVITHMKCIIKK